MQQTQITNPNTSETPVFNGEISKNIAENAQNFINETSHNHEYLLNNNLFANKGVLLEELNISLKKWQFRLHWQKTKAQKAGFWHKLKKHQQTLDLDLSCLLCDDKGNIVERVWFKNVRDKTESIRYQGDELIGDRALKDSKEKIEPKYENITLSLPDIPPHITQVVFVLSSYTGHDLNLVKQGDCSLIDDEGNDIFNITLSKIQDNTPALWLATLTRYDNHWYFLEKLTTLSQYRQADFEVEISNQLKQSTQ